MSVQRGYYNEIKLDSLAVNTKRAVFNLMDAVMTADKVDEHGSWEFGAEFDSKGRGEALNWDLYGVGRDYHNKRILAVIQVRQWSKTTRRGWANVRKSYFLIGRNEDNTVFAHPVESRVIHIAIKHDRSVIEAVQNWIFGGEYRKMKRQGDLALLPIARKPKADKVERDELVLEESHELKAKEILQNGVLYAKDPALTHLPGTHPNYTELKGWYKVIVGRRGNFYKFAAPTVD